MPKPEHADIVGRSSSVVLLGNLRVVRLLVRRERGHLASAVPELNGAAINKAVRLYPRGIVIFAFDDVGYTLDVAGLVNSIDTISGHGRPQPCNCGEV